MDWLFLGTMALLLLFAAMALFVFIPWRNRNDRKAIRKATADLKEHTDNLEQAQKEIPKQP